MSLKTLTCTEAACDDCGSACWDDDNDYGTPHFTSVEEALKSLAGNYEWTVTDTTQICRRCTATRLCEAEGHEWGDWRNGVRSSAGKRHRWCERDYCNGFEEEPIPTKFPVVVDRLNRPAPATGREADDA